MSTGRRLLSGASWTYGAQLLTIVSQFAYAAVSSRAVSSSGFGAYAIALSVTGFVTLIATGGLGQSVGRMLELETTRLRSLTTYAVILGTAASALTFLTADPWAWLWGSEASVVPIRLLAISALIAPMSGLATGLVRRLGRFRELAIAAVTVNVVGMAVGAIVVVHLRTAESLLVAPLIAQAGLLVCALALSGGLLLGFGRLGSARADVVFSWKLTLSSVLSYATGNIARICVSRFVGPSSLGQWNRADVVSTVPFQQAQTAMIQAVYPEFRHDIADAARARAVWTDMLSLVAWIALPVAAVASVVVPLLVPVLFGPGWELASELTRTLCIVAAVQISATLLGSAVEAMGWFGPIWMTQVTLIGLQLVIAVAVFVFRDIHIAIWGALLTFVVQHAIHVFVCWRRGYLQARRLLAQYSIAVIFSGLLGSAVWSTIEFVKMAVAGTLWLWMIALAIPLTVFMAAWILRRHFPPFVIAKRYKLLP